MQDTILKIQNISKFYPGVTALNNVSSRSKPVKREHSAVRTVLESLR